MPAEKGFTLIEIMIVVGLIAVVMAFGIPAFVGALKKRPMHAATDDILAVCHEARNQAIMNGTMTELVLNSDNSISAGGLSKQIDPDIVFDLVDVNLVDMRMSSEVRVRFYPNGTSDELNLLFHSSLLESRRIYLDVATALPELEVIR